MLLSEIVKDFAYQTYTFVFSYPRSHEAVEFLVGGVDHHASGIEQRDFVLSLDLAHLQHQLLAVYHLDALSLQGKEHLQLDDVNADWLVEQFSHIQLGAYFLGYVLCQSRSRGSRAA